MSRTRESGIPALRVRTDSSEEAREWNKHREAIYAIHDSVHSTKRQIASPRIEGFRPIARVDSDSGSSTVPGVGITVGRLFFIESNTITTAAGDRNKAQEVIPTLNGTALNATIAPRTYLSASDYEAWVIWRELGDTHEARIMFSGENAGPGALDRDEKAQRLATFTVTYPGGTDASGQQPGVTIKTQFIRDSLQVSTERHQFKVRKTASNKVRVDEGFVVFAKGPGADLVSESIKVPQSAEFTINANGSIWLFGLYNTAQHSTDDSGGSTTITIVNTRLNNFTENSVGVDFRTPPPTPGADNVSPFTTGYFYYEIARLEVVGGDAFVTDQIVTSAIYPNEISDSTLS